MGSPEADEPEANKRVARRLRVDRYWGRGADPQWTQLISRTSNADDVTAFRGHASCYPDSSSADTS
jgi:hypothetical protein